MQSCLAAALSYAELGYRVFPCVPGGKEPATAHGCLDATTDSAQIERWWQSMPQANVAISTDGFLVVDVDTAGKGWVATVDRNDLLAGSMAVTPNGGSHHWFRQQGTDLHNTTSKLANGVDTRANGGYVLVPPSVVGGSPYRWVVELEKEQPTAPGWLVELLGVRQPVRETVGERIPEGSRNQTMIRLAGYQRRAGFSEQEILGCLQVFNSIRCQPPLPERELARIARNAARYEPDYIEEAVILSHMGPELPEEPPERAVVFPKDCIDSLPPIMRSAYDYVLATAIKPQPELTLGSLVALFGAVYGRKVADDYDTRTNIMVLGLAPSGAGKEHPRQCNKEFLLSAGLDQVNGPERIGSHAGIITAVAAHPVRLFQLDEIGRLLATMRDPKVSHLYNVGTVLMAMYSSSNTIWTGDAYADISKVKHVRMPHVCVYGTSVPESLYSGLSPENLTDGLVGRLVVLQADGIPERRKPQRLSLPWDVTEHIRMWKEFQPAGWGDLSDVNGGPPLRAEKTPEADARHERYCDIVNSKHNAEDNIAASVWCRAPEKAAKLALIYACAAARDPEPTITLEAEEWGIKLANYSTRLVLQAARNAVSGSKYEADLKFVFAAINGDISQRDLTRKTQRLTQRQRQDILLDLQMSGAIEVIEEKTTTKPKRLFRRRRQVL